MKHPIRKNTAPRDGQRIRFAMQMLFLGLCLWIGVEFVLWYGAYARGVAPSLERPPGVEGFLPISAFMSLVSLCASGGMHPVHPAGLAILVAVLAMSLAFPKSFCSWLCPIGTLSESLGDLGAKLFGRTFLPPAWIDVPLRAIKYLLFGFLAVTVIAMGAPALRAFLDSPYNRVADVKMFLFFRDLTPLAGLVLLALALLSLVVRNFWCRYLCPYGALLGLAGLVSPFRIARNADSCIDCAKCAKVCPARIPVDRLRRVRSDECTSCMACVDACPVRATLGMSIGPSIRRSAPTRLVAAVVAAVFLLTTGAAMVTGHWRNAISGEEYARRIRDIDNPIYNHHQGRAPADPATDAAFVPHGERP